MAQVPGTVNHTFYEPVTPKSGRKWWKILLITAILGNLGFGVWWGYQKFYTTGILEPIPISWWTLDSKNVPKKIVPKNGFTGVVISFNEGQNTPPLISLYIDDTRQPDSAIKGKVSKADGNWAVLTWQNKPHPFPLPTNQEWSKVNLSL